MTAVVRYGSSDSIHSCVVISGCTNATRVILHFIHLTAAVANTRTGTAAVILNIATGQHSVISSPQLTTPTQSTVHQTMKLPSKTTHLLSLWRPEENSTATTSYSIPTCAVYIFYGC